MDTLSDILNYRPHCLCGAPLIHNISFSSFTVDNITVLQQPTCKIDKINLCIKLDYRLQINSSRKTIFYYNILIDNNLNINITTDYDGEISLNDFFNSQENQSKMYLSLKTKCSKFCPLDYQLKSNIINFNFPLQKAYIHKSKEKFMLSNNDKQYFFEADYSSKEFRIMYWENKHHLRMNNDLIFEIDNFKKIPFNLESMFDKLKFYIIFS